MNKVQIEQIVNQFKPLLPLVLDWIDNYNQTNAHLAVPVENLDFPRLKNYFSNDRLTNTKVVKTDEIKMPPLSQLGFPNLHHLENIKIPGITYIDTFYLAPEIQDCESAYFHELVHVIQWDVLGPRKFLKIYFLYFMMSGYIDSPLEKMAYELQKEFDQNRPIPDLECKIKDITLSIENPLGYPPL